MKNANEIIPGIFVGNIVSSRDPDFIKKENITAIVNASKDIPNSFESSGIRYFNVFVNDDLQDESQKIMLTYMPRALKFIRINKMSGRNILIHCHAGMQRSAAIMVSYLIFFNNMSPDNAIKLVLNKRPQAFAYGLSVNFRPAINEFYKNLDRLNLRKNN